MSADTPQQETQNNNTKSQKQYYFNILFIIVSLIFWIWAIFNTVHNSFDLGVISFLSVLITHSIILFSRWKRGGRTSVSSKCASYTIVGTHSFVTLNYLGGIYAAVGTDLIQPPDRRMGFAIYCGVAAILWLISAIVGCRMLSPQSLTTPEQRQEN